MSNVYFHHDFGFFDKKKKNKQQRNQNYFNFNKNTLQLLGLEYDVYKGDPGTFMYYFEHEIFGKITIYPKSDKLHISRQNKWIENAVKWLDENVIKEK